MKGIILPTPRVLPDIAPAILADFDEFGEIPTPPTPPTPPGSYQFSHVRTNPVLQATALASDGNVLWVSVWESGLQRIAAYGYTFDPAAAADMAYTRNSAYDVSRSLNAGTSTYVGATGTSTHLYLVAFTTVGNQNLLYWAPLTDSVPGSLSGSGLSGTGTGEQRVSLFILGSTLFSLRHDGQVISYAIGEDGAPDVDNPTTLTLAAGEYRGGFTKDDNRVWLIDNGTKSFIAYTYANGAFTRDADADVDFSNLFTAAEVAQSKDALHGGASMGDYVHVISLTTSKIYGYRLTRQ